MTEEQGHNGETEEQAQQVQDTEQPPAEPVLAEAVEQDTGDEVAALRQELEEVKAREAEYLDGWQRARAELSNARKRFQKEQEQAYGNAKADILVRLLPILDDFERAFMTMPDNLSGLTWTQGVGLIQRKFQLLLDQEGVAPIEAVGQEFDPFQHQAVTHEPSEEVPPGQVIAELQRGYRVGDRVLRPSMVRVSAGPPSEPEPEAQAEPGPVVEEPAEDEGRTSD